MNETPKPPPTRRGQGTVQAAARDWLRNAEQDGLKASTVNGHRRIIERYILASLGKVRLTDLSPTMLARFQTSLRDAASEDCAYRVLRLFRAIISEAVRGKTNENLAWIIKPGRQPKASRRQVPEWSHVKELLAAEFGLSAEPWGNKRPRSPLFRLLVETAMRPREVCSLKWQNINFERCEVHVETSPTRSWILSAALGPQNPHKHRNAN